MHDDITSCLPFTVNIRQRYDKSFKITSFIVRICIFRLCFLHFLCYGPLLICCDYELFGTKMFSM